MFFNTNRRVFEHGNSIHRRRRAGKKTTEIETEVRALITVDDHHIHVLISPRHNAIYRPRYLFALLKHDGVTFESSGSPI